ncbi:MAG: hypothetical protein ACRDJJ_09970 [Actinomycetota bacterium]
MGAAVLFALAWRLLASKVKRPELGALSFLGRIAPWIPRLLGIHLGVSLLSLAVTNTYLSPNLSLEDVAGGAGIAFVEGLIGVWLISGVLLRPAFALVVVLGPLALVLAGPIAMLEAADLLGIALFLIVLPPGRDSYGARRGDADVVRTAVWALKVCLGVALIVVAFTEKLANPALAQGFLQSNPAFNVFQGLGLAVTDSFFIRFAGTVEIALGLLILSGGMPQLMVLLAGIPFNATLFFLGRTELIGHLPIYGAMLALLVYGSVPSLAPQVAALSPLPTRPRRPRVPEPVP